MDEKAKKYVDLFRKVKIATAATVDAQGRPQARIINVMLAEDDAMYILGPTLLQAACGERGDCPGRHVSGLPVPEIYRKAAPGG